MLNVDVKETNVEKNCTGHLPAFGGCVKHAIIRHRGNDYMGTIALRIAFVHSSTGTPPRLFAIEEVAGGINRSTHAMPNCGALDAIAIMFEVFTAWATYP